MEGRAQGRLIVLQTGPGKQESILQRPCWGSSSGGIIVALRIVPKSYSMKSLSMISLTAKSTLVNMVSKVWQTIRLRMTLSGTQIGMQ